jgi:SH3-like domain-containing protein
MTPTPVVITQVVVVPNQQEQQEQVPIQASPTLPLPTVPLATDTPIATTTTASTATTAPTATLSGPTATFIKDANCRNGPGTAYPVVTSFFKGETVQIVGRNPNFNNTWWYVNIPSGGRCWVSLTTAEAYGNFDDIPTVVP